MSDTATQTAPSNEGETVVLDNGVPTEQTMTYMGGKYNSISAWEEGHKELQKTFSQKTEEYNKALGAFNGAPETYEFSEGFEANSITDALSNWGRGKQLNNDGFNEILNVFNEAQIKEANSYKTSQMEALGKDAETRITNATDWVRANLGEDAVEGVNSMWVGAKGIEAIEKMMKITNGASPTFAPAATVIDGDKLSEMRFAKDANGNRRMSTDPAYAARVMQLEAESHNARR